MKAFIHELRLIAHVMDPVSKVLVVVALTGFVFLLGLYINGWSKAFL